MKLTKLEWDQFWKVLGDDSCIDADDVPEDLETRQPGDVFEFTTGVLLWQAAGEPELVKGIVLPRDLDYAVSLETAIKRWRKVQNTAIVSFSCPKDKADAVVRAAVAKGGKQVK